MKKCTNCAKDLPDAALHCVFCGSKQPAPPPPAAGAQAKTVMGWQAADLLKEAQKSAASAGPPPAAAPPPAAPPPAAPPPAAPPPAAPAPVHSPAAVAATLVPTGPAPMGGGNPAASAATMYAGAPQPMGPPQPSAPPAPAHNPAASAATMFVQGPPPGQMGGPMPQQPAPYQPPPMQQQPPPYQQQPPYQPPPMGGYNPVPVGQPMNPPYLASQTAARYGAPVEPYKDGIKLVLLAFGAALLAVFVAPMSIDPLTFRWDALSNDKLDALAKFDQVYFAAAGLLALVFGAVPLATVPRGALAVVLGLVPFVLALVNHLRGPKIEWQEFLALGAALTLVPGLLLRNEYRSQMLPRILVTIGAACLLVPYLVPVGGKVPLAAAFELIGNAPGKAKVVAIVALLPFVLGVVSLLAWLPAPTTAGAKPIAWLHILTGVIVAYVAFLIAGSHGAQLEKGLNPILIQPWAMAAFTAFIGYGLATIFGKGLEHG